MTSPPTITLSQEFHDIVNSKTFRLIELRGILVQLGQKKSGNKSELIDRTIDTFKRMVDAYNKEKDMRMYQSLISHFKYVEELSNRNFDAMSVVNGTPSELSGLSSKSVTPVEEIVNVTNTENIPSQQSLQRSNSSSHRSYASSKSPVIVSVPFPSANGATNSANLKKRKREEDVQHKPTKRKKELFLAEGKNRYGNTLRYLTEYKIRIDLPDDPFFDIVDESPLGIIYLEKKKTFKFQQHQYQSINVDLSTNIWNLVKSRELRVQVRCFEVIKYTSMTIPDHVWPEAILVRINKEVAAVDRYDKKKCTLDLPCDITPWIRKTNEFSVAHNSEQLNCQKQYCVVFQLVKPTTSDELIERVSNESLLTIEQATERVKSSFGDDDDIVEMERKIPIFDPLQRTLIQIPAISKDCKHVQCFDLITYIKMNERLRRWKCPVCNAKAKYNTLFTDPYFKAIIASADEESSNEVVICPDGSWRFETEDTESTQQTEEITESITLKPKEDEIIVLDLSSSDD